MSSRLVPIENGFNCILTIQIQFSYNMSWFHWLGTILLECAKICLIKATLMQIRNTG